MRLIIILCRYPYLNNISQMLDQWLTSVWFVILHHCLTRFVWHVSKPMFDRYLTNIWSLFDHNLTNFDAFWTLFAQCLQSNILTNIWPLFNPYLSIVWPWLGYYLSTIWLLFYHYLNTLCPQTLFDHNFAKIPPMSDPIPPSPQPERPPSTPSTTPPPTPPRQPPSSPPPDTRRTAPTLQPTQLQPQQQDTPGWLECPRATPTPCHSSWQLTPPTLHSSSPSSCRQRGYSDQGRSLVVLVGGA